MMPVRLRGWKSGDDFLWRCLCLWSCLFLGNNVKLVGKGRRKCCVGFGSP